jgi:ArsR family transcriptional regulator, arsenate/arsenite/antimonite-responsive transcriptional repressor
VRISRQLIKQGLLTKSTKLKKMLDEISYFDNTRNMEIKPIINALSALAQESRLAIFRLLVETGPQGLPVGAIAEKLDFANATLSFHLKELTHAGLTNATPNGRSIIYSANFSTMNSLIEYLTENCCAGASCAPCLPTKSITQKKSSTTSRRKS